MILFSILIIYQVFDIYNPVHPIILDILIQTTLRLYDNHFFMYRHLMLLFAAAKISE